MVDDEAPALPAVDCFERIARALEHIVDRMGDGDRVAELEDLLRIFVGLMQNNRSTDEEWNALLAEAQAALSGEQP